VNIRAYYRLSKPGIIYGNLISALAGYFFASRLSIVLVQLVSLLFGFAWVIASACTVNNLYDRDIDQKMQRTRKRPSVTGEISEKNAVIFAVVMLAAGLTVLYLGTNLLTAATALCGFLIYTSAYTISKKKTPHSTIIGAFAGATPIIGGYLAYVGHFDLAVWLIGLLMFVWQMPHFYAIAIYREKEYRAANVPSLPITAGQRTGVYAILLYSALFLLTTLLIYVYVRQSIYILAIGVAGLGWFGFNLRGLKFSKTKTWARKSFRLSLIVMLVMSLSLAISG
jgi:protoheme IX farnesyltransferase